MVLLFQVSFTHILQRRLQRVVVSTKSREGYGLRGGISTRAFRILSTGAMISPDTLQKNAALAEFVP
jgi:hypothetical protein